MKRGWIAAIVVLACGKLSGLDALTRDDCAEGACDGGSARDGGIDASDAGVDAGIDSAADASDAEVRTFACGDKRCAVNQPCCFEPSGGKAKCDLGGGSEPSCVGFILGCDDDLDCQTGNFGEDSQCCRIEFDAGGIGGGFAGIGCSSPSQCTNRTCDPSDAGATCTGGKRCTSFHDSGVYTCE